MDKRSLAQPRLHFQIPNVDIISASTVSTGLLLCSLTFPYIFPLFQDTLSFLSGPVFFLTPQEYPCKHSAHVHFDHQEKDKPETSEGRVASPCRFGVFPKMIL
jgi:hypothetical protein